MDYLEIEFKTMLTEDEHKKLLPFFKDIESVTQINYYIDSADFALRDARIALRVRTTPSATEFTLKIPQEIGNLEYNQLLTKKETQKVLQENLFPDGKILELLRQQQIPVERLRILGSLKTIRYEKQHEIGLFALDENYYFDKNDFELEVEVKDFVAGRQKFADFLQEKQIEYKTGKSKIARFAENSSNSWNNPIFLVE